MNYDESLNFLKRYVQQEVDISKKTTDSDAGARGLILMVQEKYRIDLGLPTEDISDLRDAMLASYPQKDIERLAGRDFVADVLMEKNIDVEDYVEAIIYYNKIISSQKVMPIKEQTEEGYELTHLVWALYTIVKDNHLMRNYKDFMVNSLKNLYIRIPVVSDVSTETLYFLSVMDSNAIKEKWIMDLEADQDLNGAFTGYYHYENFSKEEQLMVQAHHTSLALLTLYNFYNGVGEVDY